MIDHLNSIRPTNRRFAIIVTAVFLVLLTFPLVYEILCVMRTSDLKRWAGCFQHANAATAIHEFNDDFNHTFIVADASRTLLDGVPFNALQPSADDARIGLDGFLFLTPDINVPRSPPFLSRSAPNTLTAVDALIDLNAQLQKRGISLLFVPIPAKAATYPEKLSGKYDLSHGPDLNPGQREWLDTLRASGIDVLDLTETFWKVRNDTAEYLFLKTDSHMTYRGVRLTVDRIAAHLKETFHDLTPAGPFHRQVVKYLDIGDLNRVSGVGRKLKKPDIAEDHIALLGPDNTPLKPAEPCQVLIIGDSNAARFDDTGASMSFALTEETGWSVQTAALVGGTTRTMRMPLQNEALMANKKVIILICALRHAMEPWERMSIAQ